MEKTLVLIKPDALQRDLLGRILSRIEEKGLQIIGLKMFMFERGLLEEHYAHLVHEPFFAELSAFMTSGPNVAVCVQGVDAIATVRRMCGVTKARDAEPGTIRGDLAMSVQRNLVHASDSAEVAEAEVARFFAAGDLFAYPDSLLRSVYSPTEAGSEVPASA